MMYLKKIITKSNDVIYMVVIYNPNDVAQMQKVYVREELGLSLIERFKLEVK